MASPTLVTFGPAYSVMRAEMAHSEATQAYAHCLRVCADEGHQFHADGTHLNCLGIKAVAPFVDNLAAEFAPDLIMSDSCLCAREGWWRDTLDRSSARLD